MNVPLCDTCAPLLMRAELDTMGKLAAKLCLACKARLGAAMVSTKTPWGAKLGAFIDGAIQIVVTGAAIAAAADTALAIVDSTLLQLEELGPKPKRRRTGVRSPSRKKKL